MLIPHIPAGFLKTNVLFHWSSKPVHFVPDTRHTTPVHVISRKVLQSHVWLEIKLHYFQLAGVLFRFEIKQVILAIVYV